VPFVRLVAQVVTQQVTSVLYLLVAAGFDNKRVRCLDVVVYDVAWEDSTLALREVKCGQFILFTVCT